MEDKPNKIINIANKSNINLTNACIGGKFKEQQKTTLSQPSIFEKIKKIIFTYIGGKFKAQQNEKNLFEKNKNSYIGDGLNEYYMNNKDKIEKVKRLTILTENLRNHIISYAEFNELKKLLLELNIFSEEEFKNLLNDLGYENTDVLFNKLYNFISLNDIDKLKTSKFIGTVSGGTISTQVKLIKEFKNFNKGKNENF